MRRRGERPLTPNTAFPVLSPTVPVHGRVYGRVSAEVVTGSCMGKFEYSLYLAEFFLLDVSKWSSHSFHYTDKNSGMGLLQQDQQDGHVEWFFAQKCLPALPQLSLDHAEAALTHSQIFLGKLSDLVFWSAGKAKNQDIWKAIPQFGWKFHNKTLHWPEIHGLWLDSRCSIYVVYQWNPLFWIIFAWCLLIHFTTANIIEEALTMNMVMFVVLYFVVINVLSISKWKKKETGC